MPKKKNELVKKDLSFMEVSQEELNEDRFNPSDLILPRVKIVQLPSEIKKYDDKYKDGMIYNTITGEVGDEICFFVLLHFVSTVWFSDRRTLRCIKYNEITTKQNIVYGPECEECLGNEEERKKGKLSHNYFIILEKDLKTGNVPIPTIYSAMGGAVTGAKKLNTKLQTNLGKRVPLYGQLVRMTTFEKSYSMGPAYMPQFNYDRYVTPEEFKTLKILKDQARNIQARADIITKEQEEEED